MPDFRVFIGVAIFVVPLLTLAFFLIREEEREYKEREENQGWDI